MKIHHYIFNYLKLKTFPGLLSTVTIICLLTFYCAALAQENDGWHASQARIDTILKQFPKANFYEDKIPPYTLPDVLTTIRGLKITNASDWMKLRRPEILELFTSQVYGRVPSTAYTKTMKVVKVDKNAMNGTATLKLVDITIAANAKSITIHLGLFTPNKAKRPSPAFMLICNRPPENIDFSRKTKREFWPAEQVIARGYAITAFNVEDVDPDYFDNFKNGIHGVLDKKRNNESWGTIAAWAWGASRCLDYLVIDKNIAHDKIVVIGHSRGGKTALWAGANDQRFAMVVSNNAGTTGTSLCKRRVGETIGMINNTFPHWFCSNYKSYIGKEDSLPVDQHLLMACVAPRALYVASADQDIIGDPHGQYLALWNSTPAFILFAATTNLPKAMPALNKSLRCGQVAYHIRDGIHDLTLRDWNLFMDFADQVLKKKH